MATERRIIRFDGAKPTRVGFLCVVTDNESEEALPNNQHDVGKLFQAGYSKYQQRKSILLLPPPTPAAINTTRSFIDSVSPPKNVTPSEPTNDLFKEKNKDLLALIQSIIKPQYLQQQSIFVEDVDLDRFRVDIEDLGCQIRAASNEKYYATLAENRYDDSVCVNNKALYGSILDRFCCPLSKRAIQTFLLMALKIDAESKSTGILQLQKYGGNGYGKRLVPVVPADSAINLIKSAKRWWPELCDAVCGEDISSYSVSFSNLLKVQRTLSKDVFNDIIKISAAPSFKMDPYRQIAMFHKCNLTYEQGRSMRPYLNANNCNPLRE